MNDSRARNVHRYRWAGDPERWGAQSDATVIVPPPGIAPVVLAPIYTQQILRTQPEDLVAIGWDLVSAWMLEGLDPGDSGTLALEVTIGSGQGARSTLLWLLATIVAGVATTQNAGAATLGWFPDPTFASATRQVGVAVSAQPIVANALSARARIQLNVAAGTPAHNVQLSLNAHCAPRSWVP